MAEKRLLGFDVPAEIGMGLEDIETPALIVDLDAFERNLRKMADFARAHGVALRAHAKAHKSADVARRQLEIGGAKGFCCQKLSEAEALVEAGLTADILITNQIIAPAKIARLVALSSRTMLRVCVDDRRNVEALSEAASAGGATLGCLVEIDVGQGRCGVAPGAVAATLAKAIQAAPGLRFDGLQAYHGAMQHAVDPQDRQRLFQGVLADVEVTLAALKDADLACRIVSGAGTGSFPLEAASGVYTELQCGTYCFMDAAYRLPRGPAGEQAVPFENALFLLTRVISAVRSGAVVCDGGHKSVAIDSGLPELVDVPGARYVGASDEHGKIDDPEQLLGYGDLVRLIPGHCDPTCNLHDYLVGVRGGVVETLWPVTARGKMW